MGGPTRESNFVTGVETGAQPTATAIPTDDNDLVPKSFLTASDVFVMKLIGPFNTLLETIDNFHVSDGAKSLVRIRIFVSNSTKTGTITLTVKINGTGSETASVSTNAGSSGISNVTLGSPVALVAGDRLSLDITTNTGGTTDDLTAELYFG